MSEHLQHFPMEFSCDYHQRLGLLGLHLSSHAKVQGFSVDMCIIIVVAALNSKQVFLYWHYFKQSKVFPSDEVCAARANVKM